MVIYCKHCGAALRVDEARMPTTSFRVKCHQCRNLLTVEPPKEGIPAARPLTGSTPPTASRSPASAAPPAGLPPSPPTVAPSSDKPVATTFVHEAELRTLPGRTHYLQKIRLFSPLSYEECVVVESRLRLREFAPFQTVVKEGGPGESMFIVHAGTVEVRKRDPNTGIEFLLAELKAGSAFGEIALLTGKPRTATVVATEPTMCGVLEQADLEELVLSYPKIGLALSRVLAERLDETSQQAGIEYLSLGKLQVDARVLKILPEQVILQHKVLPVAYTSNRLTLAMVNPNNLIALDEVQRLVKGVIIEPVVTSEDDFKRFMETRYGELLKKEEERRSLAKEQAMDLMKSVAGEKAAAEVAKLIAEADRVENLLDLLQSEALKSLEVSETPHLAGDVADVSRTAEAPGIIRLGNGILALAIRKGASDVHIEPQEQEVVVRFRIDGKLQQAQVLSKRVQIGLLSRLKALAKLDVSEKRLPQEGRFSLRMEDRPIDFRVSTIPSKWGEKACLRIRDKSTTLPSLDKMILHQEVLATVREMVAQPYGVLYVTGPPGSGKTTTSYSALAELNDPDVNISTAEDPIEYDLPRVNQVQVQREIGLDYPRVVRGCLHQEPDIILVGEVREPETAKLVVKAGLTGHLVLTTLQTNDAAGAFARLAELGIEPFPMASSTLGVIAQRLVRRLCQECREAYTPDDLSLKYLGLEPDPTITFYRHKGCEQCSSTGYKGRVGIYEVLRMNAQLRRLVAQSATREAITGAAIQGGMKTLKDYSVWLLQNAWTSLQEILPAISLHD